MTGHTPARTPPLLDHDALLAAHAALRAELVHQPLHSPGRADVFGWDIEYLSAPALVSMVEYQVLYGVNDFHPRRANPVILDCGANIGISTLHYKRCFPRARIVAFEPDPQFAPLLRRNLQRNEAEDVEVVEAAVWVKEGEARWIKQGIDGSKLARGRESAAETVAVRTVDLASYMAGEVDLIKMDIEGAEYEVVAALGDKLRAVRNLIVECHLHADNVAPFAGLLATLSASGFQLGMNSLGAWRDLVRRSACQPDHFDQYQLVAAWRDPIPADLSAPRIPADGSLFQIEADWNEREERHRRVEAELQQARQTIDRLRHELLLMREDIRPYHASRVIQAIRRLQTSLGR